MRSLCELAIDQDQAGAQSDSDEDDDEALDKEATAAAAAARVQLAKDLGIDGFTDTLVKTTTSAKNANGASRASLAAGGTAGQGALGGEGSSKVVSDGAVTALIAIMKNRGETANEIAAADNAVPVFGPVSLDDALCHPCTRATSRPIHGISTHACLLFAPGLVVPAAVSKFTPAAWTPMAGTDGESASSAIGLRDTDTESVHTSTGPVYAPSHAIRAPGGGSSSAASSK